MNLRNICILLTLICLFPVGGFCAEPLRCDINNDGKVNTSDLVFIIGWINASRENNATRIKEEALLLYPVTTDVVNLPSVSNCDLNADQKVNTQDIVFLIGWINASREFDAAKVQTEAALLYPVTTSLEVFPGLEIGSSTIPISITGITPN